MADKRALVILAEGAEEMEVTITVDVLRRAGVEVVLAGLEGEAPVVCSRRMRLVPDMALESALARAASDGRPFDVVILPGGMEGTQRLASSPRVAALLGEREAAGQLVGAICAAPMALQVHGVFAGRRMTSHSAVQETVAGHGRFLALPVVEDGNLITSRGPGTAFAFALALAARLVGPETAAALRAPMMLDDA
jgi:protein DJ-1